MIGAELIAEAQSATSVDDLLARLANAVKRVAGADCCELLARDGEGLRLRASTLAPEYANRVRVSGQGGVLARAVSKKEDIFIESAGREEAARVPSLVCEGTEALAVSLIDEWGVLIIAWDRVMNFPSAARREVKGLANQIALIVAAYENAYRAGAEANRIGPVSEVTHVISNSPYIEEILQLLVQLTAQRFDYVVVTVRLLDETHQELVLRATQAPARAYARKRALRVDESIAGRAMKEGIPILIVDVQDEETYVGHELAVEQGLRSMACVPLIVQGRSIGVMSCYSADVRDFAPDEVKALETLAHQAALSIENAKLQVRSSLMQEMHHRVKNNLQQVASLLRLQLRQSNYKSLEEAINDTLSRILAISSVHDLLSREDLDHVGIRSVAEMLVQHQKNSLIDPSRQIGFVVRGDDIRLNMSQATQVALVLNELIQNGIEHGFQTIAEGEIHVTVEATETEVSLWVSNNGDPLPEDFSLSRANLGLQIVDNLAKSLGGKFTIRKSFDWTVAEVKFLRQGMNV